MKIADFLIGWLTPFAIEFKKLTPEFVLEAMTLKRKRGALSIAAALSIQVGAFGDDESAMGLTERAGREKVREAFRDAVDVKSGKRGRG